MNIVIVSQWFPPEQAPIGHMLKELAEEFVSRGWDVTVVTGFPNHPTGEVFAGYRKSLFSEERIGKIRVWRVFLATSSRRTFLSRLLSFATFTLFSSIAILRRARPDIIFCVLQPLSVGLTMPLIANLKKAKLVFSVQDLHPDAQIRAGLISNSVFIRFLRWLERHSYRQADGLVTICDAFSAHCVDRGANHLTTVAIPNWIDLDAVYPTGKDNAFRRELGLSAETTVVLFAGTIGFASGADIVIEAASCMENRSDVKFVLVGEGPCVQSLKTMTEERGLMNVLFAPFQPRERLNEVQAIADISLVSMSAGSESSSVPSKLLGYMAAGRPVVAAVDCASETASLIQVADCGVVVDPGNERQLTEALEALIRDPKAMERYGQNGRRYLLDNRTKKTTTRRYAKFMESFIR